MANLIEDTPSWVIEAIGHHNFKVNMLLEQNIQKVCHNNNQVRSRED